MLARRLAAGVAWAAAVGLAGVAIFGATRRRDLFPDLTVYRAGAGAVAHGGGDLYGVHGSNGGGFTYPPFAALVLWPLSLPSLMVAGVALAVASFLAAATTARIALRRAAPWTAAAIVACAMQTVPFRNTFSFGQIGVLLMLLVALDLISDDPPWPRGLLIGIAAGIKLTPALFIIFLLVTGRRRAAGTAVASFMASVAVGAVVLPGPSWRYWTGIAWHTNRVGDLASGRNRSLWGLLAHAGEPTTVAVAACVAVAVVGLLWIGATQPLSPLATTAAVGLLGCLVSPITWTHHQVWVLLALAAVVAAPLDRRMQVVIVAVVTAAYARLSADTHLLAVVEAVTTALLVLLLPWMTRRVRVDVPSPRTGASVAPAAQGAV